MIRLVFLCSAAAAAALSRAPGWMRLPPGAFVAVARGSAQGGGNCVAHRHSTRWSGFTMRDVA